MKRYQPEEKAAIRDVLRGCGPAITADAICTGQRRGVPTSYWVAQLADAVRAKAWNPVSYARKIDAPSDEAWETAKAVLALHPGNAAKLGEGLTG